MNEPGYPRRFALSRFIALLLAVSSFVWFVAIWSQRADPVQRYDMAAFIRTSVPEVPYWHEYTVAINSNYFVAAPGEDFRLLTQQFNHGHLHEELQTIAYQGHSLWYVLRFPLIGSLLLLIAAMRSALWFDSRLSSAKLAGSVISGVRRVSLLAWNRSIRDKGPAIRLTWGRKLYLAKEWLNQHVVIEGGTRSGKSVIAHQIAQWALKQGPVIFLDPKREFVEAYAGPDDWILDPSDDRCPRWALEDEDLDEMRATAPATAAFPDRPYSNPFFRQHPRFIVAYALSHRRPSTKELAMMLAGDKEIGNLLRGTELAHSVTGGSEMQSSMLATLAELGRSLKFWPNEKERPAFCVTRWAKERKGNIFFTSSPDTLDALKPSQSMLLDMVILAMQKHPGPGTLILDEIAQAMDRLPKLENAISLQGAAGNPIILIFQEISQLKDKYGELWSALVAQPFTQFVLRTREKKSAEHSSGMLGLQEVIRERISWTSRGLFGLGRRQYTYTTEQVAKPAVSVGEMQNLKKLCGYVAQGEMVTKFKLKYLPRPARAQRLIERVIKPEPAIVPEPEPRKSRYAKQLELKQSGNS